MGRHLLVLMLIVSFSSTVHAQDNTDEGQRWFASSTINFESTQLGNARGYDPLGSSIASLDPWLQIRCTLYENETSRGALEIGVAYCRYEAQAWGNDAPLRFTSTSLLVPVEYVMHGRPYGLENSPLSGFIGFGFHVAASLDETYPGYSSKDDVYRLGWNFTVGLALTSEDGRAIELGFRDLRDNHWFDLSNVRWKSQGIFVKAVMPL
ncbi:hypothetical protein KQI65_09400 [bacterium]|nr:hypothetical protein [bacterium]